MTIKEHLKTQANALIQGARGREFTNDEADFLHMLNSMIMQEKIAQYYRKKGARAT